MVKSGSPWLRSLLRAGQKQQRSAARALTALLAPPKPKPRPKPKPKAVAKSAVPVLLSTLGQPKPSARPRAARTPARPGRESLPPLPPAPGTWLTAHYLPRTTFPPTPLQSPSLTAGRLHYGLYLPSTPPPPAGYPLIVMLHGCDQNADVFAQGTRMNQVAEQGGYVVVYPQQSSQAHPQRCWKWYDRATQHGGGEVPAIVGVTAQVMDAYPVDRSRVFICGMSAGAAMAHIVALNHPELFAALGMHSGPMFGAGHGAIAALGVMKHGNGLRTDSAIAELKARRPAFPPMPIILIGGTADEIVRPVNQTQLMRQAMLLNALDDGVVKLTVKAGNKRTLPYRLHDVWRGRKLMLRVAQVEALKHAWSGGDARLAFNSGAGPDASMMLVDFFGRHRRVMR